eukprot:GHRR01024440.1.p1 GENE.GHRR01024440.1~~GHRR01024440.1.p1  ORF type:complete len:135 (+),score=20.16 GHRR01024440.1:184-588(+)
MNSSALIGSRAAYRCSGYSAAATKALVARPVPHTGRLDLSQSRKCQAKATAANIKQVNAEELEARIAARDKPIVVDFFATWCGPCLLLAQELEKVSGPHWSCQISSALSYVELVQLVKVNCSLIAVSEQRLHAC